MTARRAPSLTMKLQSLFRLGMVLCVECGEKIEKAADCEWDHRTALVNEGEHSAENLGPIHRRMGADGCHLFKTRKDLRTREHVEELERRRLNPCAPKPLKWGGRKIPPSPKLRGAGFDKTLRRRMDGRIERVVT